MSRSMIFERLMMALEVTPNTPIAEPTHLLSVTDGMISFADTRYHPEEMRGGLSRRYRQEKIKEWGKLSGSMPADARTLPFLLSMAVKGGVTAAAPPNLWVFPFDETANTVKSATSWWGGAANQYYRGAYTMLESLEFANDSTSDDAATVTIAGFTNTLAGATNPTTPAIVTGSLFPPLAMTAWLDDSAGTIGTTAMAANKLISATHKITTGYTEAGLKFHPRGTGAGGLGFTQIARDPSALGLETTVMVEITNENETTFYQAGSSIKLRVRHFGKLISGPDYNYIEFDTYGPIENLEWAEHAGTNRVLKFTVRSHYDATLASQARVAVQNGSATL